MRISVLADDVALSDGAESEHGLSIYVEAEKNILFDFGASDLFLRNAERMGLDLRRTDFCVLSHGHNDHGGGLEAFRRINATAKTYMSRAALEPHFRDGADIGLKYADERAEFVEPGERIRIGETAEIFAFRGAKAWPTHNGNMTVERNGREVPDEFEHEIYLRIAERGRTYFFSGCTHNGILNILDNYSFDAFVGGLHLKNLRPDLDAGALRAIAERMSEGRRMYYACHCTGRAQADALKETLKDRIRYVSAGDSLEI